MENTSRKKLQEDCECDLEDDYCEKIYERGLNDVKIVVELHTRRHEWNRSWKRVTIARRYGRVEYIHGSIVIDCH